MKTTPKTYLGDSVYVEVKRGMLRLTTENGQGPTNVIYLEKEVYEALVAFVNSLVDKKPRRADNPPATQ